MSKEEVFSTLVSRGGLTRPSDYLYVTSVHASVFYEHIMNDISLKDLLFSTENPRYTFVESFYKILGQNEYTEPLTQMKCKKLHSHKKYIQRIAFTIFNISAKNYANRLNDDIRTSSATKRAEKRSASSMKIKKLQSK